MTERFEQLADALGITRGETVAFVGAGGKTSAILALVRELADRELKVLVSTTTRVGHRMPSGMPSLIMLGEEPPECLSRVLSDAGRAFVSAGRGADGKHLGIDPWAFADLGGRVGADVVLVEADGARHLPLKAPGENEPRIPATATLVVPVAGLDSLGRPIEEGSVHRADALLSVAGEAARGGVVTPEVIGAALTSQRGGLKDVPGHVQAVPLLNKADVAVDNEAADCAAAVMSRGAGRVSRVVVASVHDSRYAAVVRQRNSAAGGRL